MNSEDLSSKIRMLSVSAEKLAKSIVIEPELRTGLKAKAEALSDEAMALSRKLEVSSFADEEERNALRFLISESNLDLLYVRLSRPGPTSLRLARFIDARVRGRQTNDETSGTP